MSFTRYIILRKKVNSSAFSFSSGGVVPVARGEIIGRVIDLGKNYNSGQTNCYHSASDTSKLAVAGK